jgi:hypothetical protein
MVAAWGGYTFVLNMVGMHATALVRAALPPPVVWVSLECWEQRLRPV